MRYQGAKANWKGLPRLINRLLSPDATYLEPFVGAGTVIHQIRAANRIGTDINPFIISLLRAVRNGWDPPDYVSEEEFQLWKEEARLWKKNRIGDPHPMIAFCIYGCAFAGSGHSGYARDAKGKVNYAAQARRSLLRQRPGLLGVRLVVKDYREHWVWKGVDLVYCDPPYQQTAKVGALGSDKFDSKEFWDWAGSKAESSMVLVSEYSCPLKGHRVVWERTTTKGTRFKDGRTKTEKLFLLGGRGVGLFS